MTSARIHRQGPDHWTCAARTAGMRAKTDAPLFVPALPIIPRFMRWAEGLVRR